MDATPIQWAGLNHLALITDDMDTTTRFWHGVLGAPLVATIGTEAFRHYFFAVGHGATVAFFEYQDYPIDRFAKPAGVPDGRAVQFDHVAKAEVGDKVKYVMRHNDGGSTPAPPTCLLCDRPQ